MDRVRVLATVLATVLVVTACGGATGSSAPDPAAPPGPVAREPVTLDLGGGLTTGGELTYPAGSSATLPAVVLVAGSGPENRDAAVVGPATGAAATAPKSMIFAQLAEQLSGHGFVVLRYDKRHVTGPGTADPTFATATLADFAADATAAVAAARANPHVDPTRVALYGWSEGSTVAAAVAAADPRLAALVVQGPVASSWHDVFAHQLRDVAVPYLRTLAPDGRVTADTLKAALAGPGGLVARTDPLLFLADPAGYASRTLAVNPALDTDHDGAVALDSELLPRVDQLVDAAIASPALAMYGPGAALPAVREQAANLRMPVLVLQGENDANVPPAASAALDTALTGTHRVISYPGLGHTLGTAASVTDDDFRPMAGRPLVDTTSWLATTLKGA